MKNRKPPRVIISLALSLHELSQIDEAAHRKRTTRSAYIRDVTLRAVRRLVRDVEPLERAA